MAFGGDNWNIILPENLLDTSKDRLKNLLAQFFNSENKIGEKKYDEFYLENPPKYFLQGDFLKVVNTLCWDDEKNEYYFDNRLSLLLSNTCDVSTDNKHILEKELLYAPIVGLDLYIETLREDSISNEQIKSITNSLKNQLYSNIFYLPPNPNNKKEYLIFLDKIFWQPSITLKNKVDNIDNERFLSLDHFGFYLLITKISYHLCRVPEVIDR